jgi:hypothetical protein
VLTIIILIFFASVISTSVYVATERTFLGPAKKLSLEVGAAILAITRNSIPIAQKPSEFSDPQRKKLLMAVSEEELMADWEEALGDQKRANMHRTIARDLTKTGPTFRQHESQRAARHAHRLDAPIKATAEVVDRYSLYEQLHPDSGPTGYYQRNERREEELKRDRERRERESGWEYQLARAQKAQEQLQKQMHEQLQKQLLDRKLVESFPELYDNNGNFIPQARSPLQVAPGISNKPGARTQFGAIIGTALDPNYNYADYLDASRERVARMIGVGH